MEKDGKGENVKSRYSAGSRMDPPTVFFSRCRVLDLGEGA